MGLKAQRKPEKSDNPEFERTVFPTGVYAMTLASARLRMQESTFKGETKRAPKFILTWKDSDNDELTQWVGCPRGLTWNEKAEFWPIVGALAGATINEASMDEIEIDLGYIETWDELIAELEGHTNGKQNIAKVEHIFFGTTDLIGKTANLMVEMWQEGERAGNKVKAVSAISAPGGGAKRKTKAAPAATAATTPPPPPTGQANAEQAPF